MKLTRLCVLTLFIMVAEMRQTAYAATTVVASYNVNAHIGRAGEFFSEGPVGEFNLDNATANVDLGNSAEEVPMSAVAQVSARAAVGDLGLKVSGVAQVPPALRDVGEALAQTNSLASWRETVTFNVRGLPQFANVTVDFKVFIDSDISVAAVGNGVAVVEFNLIDLGTFPTLGAAPHQPLNLWGYGKAAPGVHELKECPDTLTLIMGVPVGVEFEVGYGMTLNGSANPDNNVLQSLDGLGGFEADVSGSLHWGGIVSVTGPGGIIPRDQWSITSESGFDYSKPFGVPEPSSIVLLSLGLCAWLGRARRRGR